MPNEHDLVGIAAGLEVYDLRVLDENGEGDEFWLIAALQFVRSRGLPARSILLHRAAQIADPVAASSCVAFGVTQRTSTGRSRVAAAGTSTSKSPRRALSTFRRPS